MLSTIRRINAIRPDYGLLALLLRLLLLAQHLWHNVR